MYCYSYSMYGNSKIHLCYTEPRGDLVKLRSQEFVRVIPVDTEFKETIMAKICRNEVRFYDTLTIQYTDIVILSSTQ